MTTPDRDDRGNQDESSGSRELEEVAGPGALDFGSLLASAQEAMSAQAETVQRAVEGTSGGGVVRVTMTGGGEVTAVALDPEVVDPEDVEMLQDLIVAALSDATAKVTAMQREATLGAFGPLDMGALGGELGEALNSTLGGLFGGPGEASSSGPGEAVDRDDPPGGGHHGR